MAAGIISGTATVCQGQNNVTYTVPVIANATSYIWALPSGATGSSTTNSIAVNYGTSAISGNVIVKGTNSCGNGLLSAFPVIVNPFPMAAGTISGSATVCPGQNSEVYAVPAITDATAYIWTLPAGATGTSSTNSITVNYGTSAVSGNITVKGHNACGDGVISSLAVTVNSFPMAAGTISGTTTVCQGQNSEAYMVPAITNATAYIWTLPGGTTGTSTTNSITVNYGTSAVSGSITVKGHNACGDGAVSTLAINVNVRPLTPIISLINNVLHSNALTGNQWYNQNGLISGATNQDYPVISNGNYYIRVTLSGCSSDASNTISITNTGIEKVGNSSVIKVYPNPFSSEFRIEMEGNIQKLNFEILNTSGQVVFTGNFLEKTTVQTSNFAPGMYFIKLQNGKTFDFIKITKKE